MKKAVFFDFDYTLGDSSDGIVMSVNYALEKSGCKTAGADEIKRTIGLSLADTYFALVKNGRAEDAERFSLYFKEKADEIMVDNTGLYPGVKETLSELKQKGFITGIITTKFHYRIEQILNKFDSTGLIDIIVGMEDVTKKKPDPEGLLSAIMKAKVSPDEVIYAGDSLVDAKTAENAGVDFVAVLTGTTGRQEFEKHKNICITNNITDILNLI